MLDEFDRSMERADVAKALNCDLDTASAFLRRYGVKCGGWYVIGERAFRLLQAEGEVAEFVRCHERGFRQGLK